MFYENVKKLCDDRNISIWKLEDDCGLGHATVSKWKDSDIMPNMATLQRIADFFEVGIQELIK